MRHFALVMVRQLLCLFAGLLFILESGEEDAEFIDIVIEIYRFVVFDKHDLPSALPAPHSAQHAPDIGSDRRVLVFISDALFQA